jgi:signal transduction histidine kinase
MFSFEGWKINDAEFSASLETAKRAVVTSVATAKIQKNTSDPCRRQRVASTLPINKPSCARNPCASQRNQIGIRYLHKDKRYRVSSPAAEPAHRAGLKQRVPTGPERGIEQVTPEAVLHRYLTLANAEDVDLGRFVQLVGLDADLLARWLRLLDLPVSPRALRQGLDALESWTFIDLAQAQAWAVLPPGGSVRLSFNQWRLVLRNACLAEELARELGLTDPEAVRWRIHLAMSGVMLSHDQLLCTLIEFRGTRAELLEDASQEQKILALTDALEDQPIEAVAGLAARLLGIEATAFPKILTTAEASVAAHVEQVGLTDTLQADWGDDLWTLQQVNLMAGLFLQSADPGNLYDAHALAAKTLFRLPPRLFLLDESSERLVSGIRDGHSIPVSSMSSGIARSLRDNMTLTIADSADAAVADRQVLRSLRADQALVMPLAATGEKQGVLLFADDEEVDQQFAMQVYAQALARWLSASRGNAQDSMGLLTAFRDREERRLRELVHEANNPLSIVNNYLHILELRLQQEPQALEQLRLISREIRRAADIIQSARDVPKAFELEPATAQLQYSSFDINQLVRQISAVHQGYAQAQEALLQTELYQGALTVRSDEQRVTQILNNLTKNAIEATAHGDPVLLQTRGGVYRQGVEGVEVVIQDTGPGLTREVLSKLYEPKQSTKGGNHAGLGLSIVHRLVTEVQASIDVRTEPAQGTAFTVFLPLTPA